MPPTVSALRLWGRQSARPTRVQCSTGLPTAVRCTLLEILTAASSFRSGRFFGHDGIYDSYGGDVHNVAHGAFKVGEVYGLVQPHLYGAYQLGIGIGGTVDRAALLSKKALIAKIRHKDERYSDLEEEILERVNELSIGAGGLGGKATALEVNILYTPTHIAGLPVALSISCWADRKAHIAVGEELWKED